MKIMSPNRKTGPTDDAINIDFLSTLYLPKEGMLPFLRTRFYHMLWWSIKYPNHLTDPNFKIFRISLMQSDWILCELEYLIIHCFISLHLLHIIRVVIRDPIQNVDLAKPSMYFQVRFSNLKSRRWTSHQRNRPAIHLIAEKAAGPEIKLISAFWNQHFASCTSSRRGCHISDTRRRI